MQEKVLEQLVEINRAAVEPWLRLNEIAGQAVEQVTRRQLDFARDYLNLGARQIEILSGAKDPQKWLSDEGTLFAEFGQKLVDQTEGLLRVGKETQEAVAGWAKASARAAAGAA